MRQQKGISLVIVMITLSIMLLGIAGIFRTSNSTLNIVGNLGFKQNATFVGDIGVEVARAWLITRSATQLLIADETAAYFPVWDGGFDTSVNPTFDFTKYDWNRAGNSVQASEDDGTGNAVSYVIHRMCRLSGSITAADQQCISKPPADRTKSGAENAQGGVSLYYYRVTVRVQGPRNTLSYIQVMIY